jgi:hypothetical protein
MTVIDSKIMGCSAVKNAGGIWAGQDCTLVLDNARVSGNTAVEGGGFILAGDSVMALHGGTSIFHNNSASSIGGGVRLYSNAFRPEELANLLISKGNTAYRGSNPDVSMAPRALEVVDTGNTDSFIPSANKGDGLRFTLNVSGPYGLPSDDEVWLDLIEKPSNNNVHAEGVWGTTGDKLRKVAIYPKALSGSWDVRAKTCAVLLCQQPQQATCAAS